MAGILGLATTAEIALSAAAAKTILQLKAASNHRVKVLAYGVYFDGISSSAEPVVVRILRQTTAGTMTSLTLVKNDESTDETLQTTGQHTATAEPTAGDILKRVEVHPQTGYEYIAPYGQEDLIKGGNYWGIECTAPAVVNVIAWARFEE